VEDEDTLPLPFVASRRATDGADQLAANIRATLGIGAQEQRRAKDPATLFTLLRTAAETAGIFVLLLGDLGSHHSDLGEEVFRGFALADNIAPFVVINDNDATAARSFTLLHELAHIWLGASGVSGPLRGTPDNAIERLCNETAGLFLLPPDALADLVAASAVDFDRALGVTEEVARTWNVSQGVATYRLLVNGRITNEVATQLFQAFADRWRVHRQVTRANREPGEGGPNFGVIRRS
jgi:Zn-dependent peptidase ImmA (M78 family)